MKEQNKVESTALAVAPAQNGMTALQVVEHTEMLENLGQTLAASKFFGPISVSAAKAALINCFMEGLSPMKYKAKYHTHEDGTTSIRSDYYQREFQRMGGSWEFIDWTDSVCEMAFYMNGTRVKFGKDDTLKVTMDEFRNNGVAISKSGGLKSNWKKFPREMLKARCMATAIRACCPAAMEGMYTQDEVADFDRPAKDNGEHFTPHTVAAAVAKVSPSPIAEAPAVDPSVCPCGSVKGKPWTELSSDTLEKILATPADKAKALTDKHRNAIIAELGKRQEAAEAENEAVTPEVVEG